MRRILLLSLLLAAGCIDEDIATFEVRWALVDMDGHAGPTCDSYDLGDVIVIARNTLTDETATFAGACNDRAIESPPLPVGSYRITIEMMTANGELAGTREVTGFLPRGAKLQRLAPTTVAVTHSAVPTRPW